MSLRLLGLLLLALLAACRTDGCPDAGDAAAAVSVASGCDGAPYPGPAQSPCVLPLASGTTVETGLTTCSGSFPAAGEPDQYATDFNMPDGTPTG